jgi:hypothetical protein
VRRAGQALALSGRTVAEAIINLDLWWPQGIRFGAFTVGLCCFR